MDKTINRADRYREFSTPLYQFLQKRFGSMKNAAGMLGLSQSLLSQFLYSKKPSKEFKNKCIDLGFPATYFDKLDALNEIGEDKMVDYEEIKFLYLGAKYIIEQQKEVIEILERRIKELNVKVGGKW